MLFRFPSILPGHLLNQSVIEPNQLSDQFRARTNQALLVVFLEALTNPIRVLYLIRGHILKYRFLSFQQLYISYIEGDY